MKGVVKVSSKCQVSVSLVTRDGLERKEVRDKNALSRRHFETYLLLHWCGFNTALYRGDTFISSSEISSPSRCLEACNVCLR